MHRSPSTTVEFDEAGRLYSGGYDSRVIAWQTNLRDPKWIAEHDGLINAIVIGSTLVYSAGADRIVRSWDRETGKASGQPLLTCPEDINALILSPDEHRIATASDDGILRVFNLDSGTLLWARSCSIYSRYGESIESLSALDEPQERLLVAVDNSGNVVVVDFDGSVRHVGSLHSADSAAGAPDIDTCTVSSATRELFCGTADGHVLRLGLDFDRPVESVSLHKSAIKAIATTPRRIAVTAYDNQLTVGPLAAPDKGRSCSLLDSSNWGWARGLAFSPVAPTILASTSLCARPQVWNIETMTADDGPAPRTLGLNACAPCRGRIFAGGDDGHVWVIDQMREARALIRLDAMVLGLAAHPQRFLLMAVTHAGSVFLIDPGTGSVAAAKAGILDPATACTFSADGLSACIGFYSGRVALLSIPKLVVLAEAFESDTVKAVAHIGSTDEFAVGTADGTIVIRDASSLKPRVRRDGLFLVNDIHFCDAKQRLLSVGRDQLIREWDLSLMQLSVRLGHERSIKCVAVSPEGGRIASGGYDGAVEIAMGSQVFRNVCHSLPGVAALHWLDSSHLASAGWDGAVCVLSGDGDTLGKIVIDGKVDGSCRN